MRVVLTAVGSLGDVIPMWSLGQLLVDRGHEVWLTGNSGFREQAVACGMGFVAICDDDEHRFTLRDIPLLGTRHRSLFFQRHVVNWNFRLMRFLAEQAREDSVYVSAERPTLWADLCAHKHFRMPCVRLGIDLPVAPRIGTLGGTMGGRMSAFLEERWQLSWRLAVREMKINAGPRHTERLVRGTGNTVPRIALWPEWFAPAVQVRGLAKFGFVGEKRDRRPVNGRPTGGKPLLIFLAGSMGTTENWEGHFAAVSRELCERMGCDGLLLGGNPPAAYPSTASFRWEKFVPLDDVLPQASAVVHHGGIGTIAAGLKAGVPQLILPRAFGQSANADCARRLGVATVMAPESYSVDLAKIALERLMGDPRFSGRAREFGGRIDGARDAGRVCDFIEEYAQRSESNRRPTRLRQTTARQASGGPAKASQSCPS